jgi:catechol 2,3-dioxygenase-like lactoylglutathione lyase family enzyme
MIKKIDHINVVVSDLEASKKFFAQLGFVTKREGAFDGSWIETLTHLNHVSATFAAMALPNDSVVLDGCVT